MLTWNLQAVGDGVQTPEEDTFWGGKPKLPPAMSVPICGLCGQEMTFFLQVAFPQGHPWQGKSLALFYCTDTWHDQFCLPEAPDVRNLNNADIPSSFLRQYERTFRTLVFDTDQGVLREDCTARIAYQALFPAKSNRPKQDADVILGGEPVWIMGWPERPACVDGNQRLTLLAQIREGLRFPRLEGAPPQVNPFLRSGLSSQPWYHLFARARVYLWGTEDPSGVPVYISVQAQ